MTPEFYWHFYAKRMSDGSPVEADLLGFEATDMLHGVGDFF